MFNGNRELKRPGLEAGYSFPFGAEAENDGTVPPRPPSSSWSSAQCQVNVYAFHQIV
jgi:hypothetical protein